MSWGKGEERLEAVCSSALALFVNALEAPISTAGTPFLGSIYCASDYQIA